MLCDDVKRIAYFFLDGELGQSKLDAIREHLRLCPGCGDRVMIHRRLRELIRLKIQRASAPERLRTRIIEAMRNVRAEM